MVKGAMHAAPPTTVVCVTTLSPSKQSWR